jgi:hypothetical protein
MFFSGISLLLWPTLEALIAGLERQEGPTRRVTRFQLGQRLVESMAQLQIRLEAKANGQ